MRKTHAPYPPEFREEAVRLVQQSGKSIGRVAKEVGVSDQSLRNWVKRATVNGAGVRPDGSPRPLKGDSELSVSGATGVLKTTKRKPPLRRFLAFLLAIILGVVAGIEIHRTNIAQRFSSIHDIARSRSTLSSFSASQSAISPDALAGAWKMMSEGRLQEAQDMFLEILQEHPDQQEGETTRLARTVSKVEACLQSRGSAIPTLRGIRSQQMNSQGSAPFRSTWSRGFQQKSVGAAVNALARS